MFKARLKLNISSLDLGADVLAGVVNMLPDRPDAMEWYEELAKCPSSSVKVAVACKTPLSDETVRLLALDKNQAVRIALLCNDSANQRIEPGRIEEWIAADDAEMLQAILQNAGNMTQLDTARIFQGFARHSDAAIRLEVAGSSEADVELLHQLAHDEDPNVRTAALNTIRQRNPAAPDADWED
jgi:hypothetical protein